MMMKTALGFWGGKTPCWEIFCCPETIRDECPAFKYRNLPCWQIEGTYCKLLDYGQRGDSTDICWVCQVYKRYGNGEPIEIKHFGKGFNRPEGAISYAGRIFKEIQEVIDRTRGQAGAIIPVLQHAQRLIGYLPAPVIKTISRDLKISLSEVYGIISFYHFFSTVPKGKYVIQVCMGTSCYVKGGQRLLDAFKKGWGLEPGMTTADGKFSLETVRCLGCCGLSPVMAIGSDVHRKVKASELRDILTSYP